MNAREALSAIETLPFARKLRLMHLSGNQERVIAASEMRRWLPAKLEIVAGPGSAAAACPPRDLFQALCLAEREGVRLLALANLMHLPLGPGVGVPATLAMAAASGLDIAPVAAPVEAVIAAQDAPEREFVLFVAGFETVLAPLAGQVLAGLPDNLSLLLCGRRVNPLIDRRLADRDGAPDGLILPGNRCALTGTRDWERLSGRHRVPGAVAGYSVDGILAAVHAVVKQSGEGDARITNCYRGLARPDGNGVARERMLRVFELVDGDWRGLGSVPDCAYRLRDAFRPVDADSRFPDHRFEYPVADDDLPAGCECGAVSMGRLPPAACANFGAACEAAAAIGPCMAAVDGSCFIRSRYGNTAAAAPGRRVVGQ